MSKQGTRRGLAAVQHKDSLVAPVDTEHNGYDRVVWVSLVDLYRLEQDRYRQRYMLAVEVEDKRYEVLCCVPHNNSVLSPAETQPGSYKATLAATLGPSLRTGPSYAAKPILSPTFSGKIADCRQPRTHKMTARSTFAALSLGNKFFERREWCYEMLPYSGTGDSIF